MNFVSPLGYYSYGDDGEINFSQGEESEGEDSFGEEGEEGEEELLETNLITSHPPNNISPLTTLASLASGSVKNESHSR